MKYVKYILILFLLLVISYLLYNNYDRDDIVFKSSRNIKINNLLPLSSVAGSKINDSSDVKNYIDLEVKSKNFKRVKYEIYIVNKSLDNSIRDKDIRIYLVDENNNILLNRRFSDLYISKTNPNGRLLVNDIVQFKKHKKYKLRVWLDENYVMKREVETFLANIYINVY